MNAVGHSAKRIGRFARGIGKNGSMRSSKIRCIKLPISVTKTLKKKAPSELKVRIFKVDDKSKQETKGVNNCCLNQSFLYQSLEEGHMRKEKIPERVVLWKLHAPEKIRERLEKAGKAIRAETSISQRKIADLAKEKQKEVEREKSEEEWDLFRKPEVDRHFRIAAIRPYE